MPDCFLGRYRGKYVEETGGAGKPLPWEQLVTEGHVRAARLREAQPRLISIAIALIVLGAALQFTMPAPVAPSQDVLIRQQTDALFAPAIRAVSNLPVGAISPDDRKDVEAHDDLTEHVTGLILDSLNRTGRLPDRLRRVEVDPRAFWRQPWPYSKAVVTENDDLKLVGSMVKVGTKPQPDLQRWLGIYRRRNGHWQYASLAADNFYSTGPSARVRDIALDLAPLLPPDQ